MANTGTFMMERLIKILTAEDISTDFSRVYRYDNCLGSISNLPLLHNLNIMPCGCMWQSLKWCHSIYDSWAQVSFFNKNPRDNELWYSGIFDYNDFKVTLVVENLS